MKSFEFPRDQDVMREYLADDYEPEVREVIEQNVKPGTRCLNVGANVGYFAFLMHALGGEVLAVEPDPENIACLRKNCPDVPILEVAASDTARSGVTMYRDWRNSGNSSLYSVAHETFEADCVRLESVLLNDPEFAVFDCQGHDHIALVGCGRRRPPVVVVEHWPPGIALSGWTRQGVVALYEELGYNVSEVDHMNLLLTRA